MVKDLDVAAGVLRAIVQDMLLADPLWRTELVRRTRTCGAALDAISAHHVRSDRERSFATAIASRLDRCRDGLHMIAMGLPRGRQDMISHGELTTREATLDIDIATQILRH